MILKPHPQAPIINHQSTTATTFFLNSQHSMPPFFLSNSTPNPFRIYSKFKPLLFPIMSHSTTTTKTRLRGVVFDMDGTLTVPVIDFQAMYRAVLGDDEYRRMKDDNPSGIDILHQIENFSPDKQRHAYATIADFERQALDRLQIMPGTAELCGLLDSKKIRRGLITRNVKSSVDLFHERFGVIHFPHLCFFFGFAMVWTMNCTLSSTKGTHLEFYTNLSFACFFTYLILGQDDTSFSCIFIMKKVSVV
ncbi:PREDICTED: haloacid dehalogenase-like hydrolase domain-containing protein At2g33255 isoform X2 [Lupinus angustifolius]|uniref:haloacid dehalogenase-like hydrolase domain-containing protein At2g33255 isoform X2 n=1 Tax=Lupinus angustifolius TaxID=3871 RepID=UPI00092F74B5|nr:PREDICTED: haloacid dehalogenase-like hydrolase domain-containing protein At2g33255 isoform X2 [Lupinus angustifolius]